jgi:hypothetical protein
MWFQAIKSNCLSSEVEHILSLDCDHGPAHCRVVADVHKFGHRLGFNLGKLWNVIFEQLRKLLLVSCVCFFCKCTCYWRKGSKSTAQF